MWEQSEHRVQTSRRAPKERRVRRARRMLTPQAWQDRRAPQGPRRTGWDHRCGPAREPTGRAGPRGHRRSPHTTVRRAERAQKEPRMERAQKEPRARPRQEQRAQKEPRMERAQKEPRARPRQEQRPPQERRAPQEQRTRTPREHREPQRRPAERQRTRGRRGRSRGNRARSGRERWRGRARAGRWAPPSPAIRDSCGRRRSRWAFARAASTRLRPAPRHRVRPRAPRACAGRRGGCRSGPSARCARR